jgi:hypothetical protein
MSDVEQAANRLLAARPGDGNSSKQVAERAADACERLAKHLSRLLGETGVRMLFERSVVMAGARFPWLRVAGDPHEHPCSTLRRAMEQQESDAVTGAFVEIMSTFVGVLKRLIGDGLVDRLLHELWPAVFAPSAKDTP